MDLLFVYGTLLKHNGLKVTSMLQEKSLYYDSGNFPGSLFEVDGYPGAIYQPESENFIYGNVLSFKNPEIIFQELDKYEEVGAEFPEPNEYVRNRIPILCSSGDIRICWVYLYNWTTRNLKQIPSGKYSDWRKL